MMVLNIHFLSNLAKFQRRSCQLITKMCSKLPLLFVPSSFCGCLQPNEKNHLSKDSADRTTPLKNVNACLKKHTPKKHVLGLMWNGLVQTPSASF